MSVIRHYTLRFLIYLRRYGPWNYTQFLDYAVDELHFMQRVGGGYIFIHRMLLEHFAEMEDAEVPGKEKPCQAQVLLLDALGRIRPACFLQIKNDLLKAGQDRGDLQVEFTLEGMARPDSLFFVIPFPGVQVNVQRQVS